MSSEITTQDGYYIGPWRAPENEGRGTTGNIHADEDARRLGFRGGLVAGSIISALDDGVAVLREAQLRTSYVLHTMPKPTIAMVNGYAVGAGFSLSRP